MQYFKDFVEIVSWIIVKSGVAIDCAIRFTWLDV